MDHQAHQEVGERLDQLGKVVVDARLKIHRLLGPGLLESTYEHCLAHELAMRKLTIQRQVALPIVYDGVVLDAGYRLDLLVALSVIVEIKSVDALNRLHESQIPTYLKLSRHRLAFLINFNVSLFKQGVRRFVA